MAGTFVDRLIGWINPHAGLSRHFARERLTRAYEAASPRDKWRPRRGAASSNADHRADAATLRAKARALVQNVPYIRAGLDAMVAQIVGTGIVPQATGQGADTLNKLFAEWVPVCDADGRLDYYGLQAALLRAMEQDGEVMLRLRWRRPTDGLPVPLQLQLLEIDWLDTTRTGRVNNNQVINGIEYDLLGRVAAYWLWPQHPGEDSLVRGARMQSSRIPADVIIHLFNPERPGQGRGFTRFAPVIASVRDLQLYMDAEIARKNLESRLSVVASGDVAGMANPLQFGGAADPDKARETGELGQLASGGITQLPAGMNLTAVEPNAAPGYVDYLKFHLHLIAAGCGWTYEMMTGDMKEVNFSSARVRQLDFRRQAEQTQWVILIPKALQRVHQAFVDAAHLAGKVRTADYGVSWSPPKWNYVNIKDEVGAEQTRIATGITSISQTIRDHGDDPNVVFAQMKADYERLKADGTLDLLLLLQRGTVRVNEDAQPGTAAE